MKAAFRLHGQFSNRIVGQMLLVEIVGPWNLELVDAWSRDAHTKISHFTSEMPYVAITTVKQSMLCPPDAMAMLGRVERFSREKMHCLGNGIVADPKVDGRHLLEAAYARIGYVDFFDEFALAKQWAEGLLANFQQQAR